MRTLIEMMNAAKWKVALVGIFFFMFFFPNATLLAQNHSEYNWLFGNSTSTITFNKSDARAQLDTIQFVPYGTGGGAVITDPVTGNLLFYTDGENVYDSNHELVPNGAGLGGDASINRSASVMPMPYTDGEYYIFTNPGGSGPEILYTVADRNLVGNAAGGEPPLGDVDAARKNIGTGLTNPSEAMIVIQRNIDDYWVITNDRTNFDYQVLEINNGILGAIQVFDLNDVSAPDFQAASFAYDENNGVLAVAPKDANRNVTLYDFDITSGVLTLNTAILNTGNADFATEAVYDIEWSASGENLYISRHGGAGTVADLYQYNLSDPLNTVNSILFQPVFRSYGVQRGPDDNIYHLYQQTSGDAIELGVILEADSLFHPDSTFFNVGYDSLAFTPSGISGTQFPHFAAPHFETFDSVGFAYLDTCALRTTKFFSNVEPPPQSYMWDMGDGFTTNAVNPVHTFQAAGSYPVSLTVELNGVTETYSRTITVVDNDLQIDLGMDTVRCVGEIFTYDAGPGGEWYYWNTGEFTQSINVDTTGLYTVAVKSAATGCINYDYVQVTTYEDTNIFRNQWYFGENAGIDFNPPATSAITDANLMSSAQGASAVSDLNGDVLFYTNGETIWNKNHRVMDNGDNIGGDPNSSQGVMIVPLPQDSSIYYVFTSDPVYGDFTYDMKYAVVDMRQDTAQGEVIVKDVSLFTNSTERITAFGLGQGITWLVTHEYGNNQFRSYPLTPFGIGAPITSSAGSVMRFDEEKTGRAQMKYAAAGGVIALAFQDETENFVELFSVADSTGQISGLVKIDIDEPVPSLVYGIEFSSSLQRLYVSTNGSSGSTLLQYDLDSLYAPTAKADIEATKFTLGTSSLQYGALQTGSDGIIYMAVDGQSAVGQINSPNSDDAAASFSENGFDLMGRTSRLGLPNFVQELPLSSQNPGIAYSNPCLGLETVFDATGTSIIDEYFWSFDDGTFANVEDTTHVYNLSGTYNVSLQVTNRCGLDTLFVEPVEIFPIPAEPTLADAAALCNGPLTLEAWPVDTAAFTYTWSTGETTRTITVDSPSLISVYITNTDGCQSDPRESFIDDTRPVVDLGADQTICQDVAFADLDALNPGSTYLWSLNGTANGNVLRTQAVDTSVPGVYVYEVTVEDIFNCVTTDDVAFTIENNPEFTTVGGTTTGCGNNDGTIDIDVTETGSFNYSVNGPSTIGTTALTGPSMVTTPNTLIPGGYSITVTNTLTGCSLSQVATVDDAGAGFTIDNYVPTPDCPGDGILTFELAGPAPASVNYELFDEFGSSVVSAPASPSPTFPVNNLDSGTYSITVVELISGLSCTQTLDNIVLGGSPLAEYETIPQNICGTEGEISIYPTTVDPSITYTWSGPGIVGSSLGETITVSAGGNYSVTSSGAGYCEVTETISVVQNPAPIVEILEEGAECESSLILFANVTNGLVGNGSYQWDNGANGSRRGITSSGTYDVLVLDQGSGCTGSATSDVNVYSELTVFAAASPNCDNNEEVFITAYSNITEDVTFTWTGPTGETLENQSAEISVGESGTYSIHVDSDISTCEADASLSILVVPITEDQLLLNDREMICSEDPDPANNSVDLDPGQFSTYEWTIINDDVLISTDRVFTASEGGVYEVTLSNGFTCIRDAVEVIDDCLPKVYAPNAFTPETSPGFNDEFFVYPNPYVDNFEIKIYSRWGELVFQSEDIGFRWDGTYRGKILKIDSYIYVMRFTSSLMPELGEIEQRGGVVLLR